MNRLRSGTNDVIDGLRRRAARWIAALTLSPDGIAPPLGELRGDPELFGGFLDALTSNGGQVVVGKDSHRPSKPSALRRGPLETRFGTLGRYSPFVRSTCSDTLHAD
jgi:hypothetical protein